MRFARLLVLLICAGILATLPAAASHLVTGNGYGFAVVSPETGTATRFYAHPYSFLRPDPKNSLSEGVETTNFIKVLGWGSQDAQSTSSDYVEDSHIIRVRGGHGEAFCFMPLGLQHAALVIGWQPGSANPLDGGIQVEWSHPVMSRRVVRMFGADMQLHKFDDVPQSLLLIPLGLKINPSSGSQQDLAGNSAWALVSLEAESEFEQTASDFKTWRGALTPQELVEGEIAQVEQWRTSPAVTFASEEERHLWRQSEVMLRIAQSREPNRPGRNGNGLIVASLPDGVWFTPWVRDMAYATVALARMGHKQEARAPLLAYFNARPTGKMSADTRAADYQVSVVRYFGNGEEEPFFTEGGSTNIEFDDGASPCGRLASTCGSSTIPLCSAPRPIADRSTKPRGISSPSRSSKIWRTTTPAQLLRQTLRYGKSGRKTRSILPGRPPWRSWA
jgi:hypothetical protein